MSCAASSHDWEFRSLGGVLVFILHCLHRIFYISVMHLNVKTSFDNYSELVIYFSNITPLIFIKYINFLLSL